MSPVFHAVCSSMFVSKEWIYALNEATSTGGISYFLDFRFVAASNFILLQLFCGLANQTIQDSLAIFNKTPFINTQVLPSSIINLKSQALATTFQQSIANSFSLQIAFIQAMSYGNQLLSSSFTNDNLYAENSNTNNLTVEIVSQGYIGSNGTQCSCLLEPSTCSSPSAIYQELGDDLSTKVILLSVPSFVLGCFSIDSVFLSSLECFYNQSCIDALQPYITEIKMIPLNASQPSRYRPNTRLQEIIEQLLVETWNTTISFESYFAACAPHICTYTYEKRGNFLFLLTTIFSLIGGLTVMFRYLSPFLTLVIFNRHRRELDDTPPVTYRIRRKCALELFQSLHSKKKRFFRNPIESFRVCHHMKPFISFRDRVSELSKTL